jgi:hypothetical protein
MSELAGDAHAAPPPHGRDDHVRGQQHLLYARNRLVQRVVADASRCDC